MKDILATAPHQTSWFAAPAQRSRWQSGLAALRDLIAIPRERARLRWELKLMAKANPHLIDDIGLTRQQVDAEIARLPFWQR